MKYYLTFAVVLGLILNACNHTPTGCYVYEDAELSCINLIDRDGFTTTIQAQERLRQYAEADFLTPQPYEKVLRIYKKSSSGNSYAFITTYHTNGQPNQYLEIKNAGACGAYKEWHENGQLKLEGTIIGGTADITLDAQRSWKFDKVCKAWDDNGNLIAVYNYDKGSLEGEGCHYYPGGQLRSRTHYTRNLTNGPEEMFFPDGLLMATANWENGELRGKVYRYWPDGKLATEEEYDHLLLLSGKYYDPNGTLVSEIIEGEGHRAVFENGELCELHQYQDGLEEGEVRVFDQRQNIARIFHVKDGFKHGTETVYYPAKNTISGKNSENMQPQLLITWNDGKVHGVTRTWYQNGNLESQREMADNRRNGIATAWYRDGSLMLMEEYDSNKLVKGEYFKKGEHRPESLIINGCGIATLYDSDGQFLRRTSYFHGQVLD